MLQGGLVPARVFWLCFALLAWWGAIAGAVAQEWQHSPPEWRVLSRGLSFAQVQVFHRGEGVGTLAVVKIDPALNAFRVRHHAEPQSLTDWQAELNAPVVFNASYFCQGGNPCGLVVADGKLLGPLSNRAMRGMFVAEPKGISPDLPRAAILDLTRNPVNPRKLPWTQGVQSFPLLVDVQGRIRVGASPKKAYRTVIATDRQGNILVFNTLNDYFTLHDLARFLKASQFEIACALNLDGGSQAQLYIKTPDFQFFSPPLWEARLRDLVDWRRFALHTVVAVYPRSQ